MRKDTVVRLRLSYSFRDKIKKLADKKGITISDLIRETMQAEIDKSKEAI